MQHSICKGKSNYEFLNPEAVILVNKTRINNKKNTQDLRVQLTSTAQIYLRDKVKLFMKNDAPNLIKKFRTNANESFNALLSIKIPKSKNFHKSYYLRVLINWLWWNNRNEKFWKLINNIEDYQKIRIELPKSKLRMINTKYRYKNIKGRKF